MPRAPLVIRERGVLGYSEARGRKGPSSQGTAMPGRDANLGRPAKCRVEVIASKCLSPTGRKGFNCSFSARKEVIVPDVGFSGSLLVLLEKEMATHSRMLTWEIPRTEEPGGLQSMELQQSDMT